MSDDLLSQYPVDRMIREIIATRRSVRADEIDQAHSDADHVLRWAFAAWEELPEIEREIDSGDLLDQHRFTEEWQIKEDRLWRLSEFDRAGDLSPAQSARYQELLKLDEERRPIIERIMRG